MSKETELKNKLENRMIVETREGKRYMVVDNILVGKNGYSNLNGYTGSLKHETFSDLDIMKVYTHQNIFKPAFEGVLGVVWERKEPKKLTVSEIEDLLGYPVEIVKESEE